MKKVELNKNIFSFGLRSKPYFDILGITVSMCEKHDFETISISNEDHTLWEWIFIFVLDKKIDHIQHLTMDL